MSDVEDRRERLLAAGHEAGKKAFQTYGITRLDKMVEAIVLRVDEMVRREFADAMREDGIADV